MRTPLVVANWKMNGSQRLCATFSKELLDSSGTDIWLAPPYLYLPILACDKRLQEFVEFGVQNVNENVRGAFTGEISAKMVADTGAKFAIIGHSERRTKFLETDTIVDQKLNTCLDAELVPVLCVGESLEQRQNGNMQTVVSAQLRALKCRLESVQADRVVIAYEPKWAIGTGVSASPVDANEMHSRIRDYLGSNGTKLRILYGGSVNPNNVQELINQPEVDGCLVGGASLDPNSFNTICQVVGSN